MAKRGDSERAIPPTLLVGAVMVLMVGFACARLLHHRNTTGII
jgi:hypothetical protein